MTAETGDDRVVLDGGGVQQTTELRVVKLVGGTTNVARPE